MCCETGKVLRERSFLCTSIVYLGNYPDALWSCFSYCVTLWHKTPVGLVSISSKQKNWVKGYIEFSPFFGVFLLEADCTKNSWNRFSSSLLPLSESIFLLTCWLYHLEPHFWSINLLKQFSSAKVDSPSLYLPF